MKSLYLICLIILLSSCSKTIKKYYNDGTLKEEYEKIFHVKHGYFKTYHPNGMLKLDCFYRYNKLSGYYRSYYSSGKLEQEGYYRRSKKTGTYMAYHENGQLLNSGSYKNDTIDKMKCYSKEGLLHYDYFSNTHFAFYRYYENESLYKIEYIRAILEEDKKTLKMALQDTCLIYSYTDHHKDKPVKRLSIYNLNNTAQTCILSFYSSEGTIEKVDTMKMGEEVECIKKQILGRDTLHLKHVPKAKRS